MKPAKVFFQREVIQKIQEKQRQGQSVRLLELGCGAANVAVQILKACPGVEYVGIEPSPTSSALAKKQLATFANATVLDGLAYGNVVHAALTTPFDIVFSLSVLEHVKDLPTFLAYAAKQAKTGGEIIHLYDLGHSLYPSNWKERLQIAICDSRLRTFVPESKIAGYLATEDTQRLLEQLGCAVQRVTFHNLRSSIALSDALPDDGSLMDQILALEAETYPKINVLKQREKLFPTVCFWTIKRAI